MIQESYRTEKSKSEKDSAPKHFSAENNIDMLASSKAKEAAPKRTYTQLNGYKERMSYELAHFLKTHIQPNAWTDCMRQQIYTFVEEQVRVCGRSLGIGEDAIKIHLFGSYFLSTYLPEGDIDITVQCPIGAMSSLMNIIYERFKQLAIPVQFVQADVKLVKCHINEICVDISFNQLMGLTTAFFVTDVNDALPNNLFKRSLLLLKAWAYYESRTLGAHGGMLGSYALTIMLVSVINQMQMGLLLTPHVTELDVLLFFFEFYAQHDIRNHVVTIYGLRCINGGGVDGHSGLDPMPEDTGCLINREFMQIFRARNRAFFKHLLVEDSLLPADARDHVSHDPPYDLQDHRSMNIADPLRSQNNLARGVHYCHATRIHLGIRRAASELRLLLDEKQEKSAFQVTATPPSSIVRRKGVTSKVPLKRAYPNGHSGVSPGSILCFFENAFRKCVLSKLIDEKPQDHRHVHDIQTRQGEMTDRARLNSLVAHGKTSPIRQTTNNFLSGIAPHPPRGVYPGPMCYPGYSLYEARGRRVLKKPKRQMGWFNPPLAYSNYPSPKNYPLPQQSVSPITQSTEKQRCSMRDASVDMTSDTPAGKDHHGFQAGDLISFTLPIPHKKQQKHKTGVRRSSSCGNFARYHKSNTQEHLPTKVQRTDESASRISSQKVELLGPKPMQAQPNTMPHRRQSNEAFHPIKLRHERQGAYHPVVRSPYGIPMCVPPSPMFHDLPMYPMPFAGTAAQPFPLPHTPYGSRQMHVVQPNFASFKRVTHPLRSQAEHSHRNYCDTVHIAHARPSVLPPHPVFRTTMHHISEARESLSSQSGVKAKFNSYPSEKPQLYIPPHLRS